MRRGDQACRAGTRSLRVARRSENLQLVQDAAGHMTSRKDFNVLLQTKEVLRDPDPSALEEHHSLWGSGPPAVEPAPVQIRDLILLRS